MHKQFIPLVLSAMLFALCVSADAQQSTKIPRIGYVAANEDPNSPGRNVEAFRQGLRDLGYIEGKNIFVEYRYAEGVVDRIPSLVAELVQLNVDVLVRRKLCNDPCGQAGDQDDSHRHRDCSGSSRRWPS